MEAGRIRAMKRAALPLSLLTLLLLPPIAGAAGSPLSLKEGLTPEQRALIRRSNGVCTVLEAAEAGDAATLRERLKAGDDPNQADELGNRPLHLAARGKSLKVIRLLIAAGADCRARDARGRTPLQLSRHEKMRQLFRQADKKRQEEIDAFALVKGGQADALRKALRAGLNPNARSEDSTSCLLLRAVEAGQKECLRALLEARARPDILGTGNGLGALHIAAQRGRADLIRLLLAAGADPMLQARNGALALHDAIWHHKLEAVKALLPAYKKINFNPDGGRHGFPVNMAIIRGGEDFLQAFLDAGLQPDEERFRDATPLITAARNGREACIRLLLEAGADPTRRDSRGKTAADYAPESLAPLLR